VAWIHLAQDKVQWQVLVDTVMTFGFHKRRGISSLAEQISASAVRTTK
jgi:hypothetical protein